MIKIPTESGGELEVDKLPESCPYCHRHIDAKPLGSRKLHDEYFQAIFLCPSEKCRHYFLGYYRGEWRSAGYFFQRTNIGNQSEQSFEDYIHDISPAFVSIYNEAYSSEQYKLFEICGVGYRKAFEFLIKDYCILNYPDKVDQIKNGRLGNCIQEYVKDEKIKMVSKRVTWLGNDQTHYVKKWAKKDLTDLKALIRLTLHWIGAEELTKTIKVEMAE